MLEEQKQELIKNRTRELREKLELGKLPDLSDLQAYLNLVEGVVLEAQQASIEHENSKRYHAQTEVVMNVLAGLGAFSVQELIPEQWAIEANGKVIASGPSLMEAARSMMSPRKEVEGLASVKCEAIL